MNSEKKYPKIAVILAVYNGKKWIEEQINSVLHQDNINLHIFISIDPSNDGSQEWCQELADTNKQVTLLDTNEKFGSAAPNFFRLVRDVDFSNFDYIAFADQDDIWNHNKLERAIKVLNDNNYDGYSSNVTAFWADGRKILIDKAQPQVEWDYLFESAGPGCTFVITQKLALDIQLFICTHYEKMGLVYLHDWFIYAFARSQGYKWYIDKLPSMLYRQHQSNQVGINNGYKAFLHRVRYVLSGKAMEQSSLIATLCGLGNNQFVKPWHNNSRLGMLYLALNAQKCRRKRSEQLIFSVTCSLLFFIGNNIK